jgi:hypothetical protein
MDILCYFHIYYRAENEFYYLGLMEGYLFSLLYYYNLTCSKN